MYKINTKLQALQKIISMRLNSLKGYNPDDFMDQEKLDENGYTIGFSKIRKVSMEQDIINIKVALEWIIEYLIEKEKVNADS